MPFTLTTAVVIQPVDAVYVIVDVPTATAVHNPLPDTIVATDGVLLDHVPPGVALLSVAVADWHRLKVPVIGDGNGCTVNVIVVKQPEGVVYVIVVVPGAGVADTPPTTPVPKPTVPIAGVLLVHVPPVTGCVSVVVCPSHTALAPTIGAGAGVTVTTNVEVHPALSEYVIVVVPGAGVEDIPPTMPVDVPTVPMEGVLLDHEPPGVLLVSIIVEPTHTLVGPTIGAAADTTVIIMVTAQPATW